MITSASGRPSRADRSPSHGSESTMLKSIQASAMASARANFAGTRM